MKYRVTHTTEYSYGEAVPLCHNLVRLRPREASYQSCPRNEIQVSPPAAARRERIDFFGNHACWMSVQEPHQRLRITGVSEVRVSPRVMPNSENLFSGASGYSWEHAAHLLATSTEPDTFAARQFTYESPYAPYSVELAAYARPSFGQGRPILDCLKDFNQRVNRDFAFVPASTNVGTSVLEVLRQRRGVCQDFAHLSIAALRSLGLAARYVSGYFATRPPPGQQRLRGADVSHAWFGAFLPGIGWLDFDPTHGVMPHDRHVTLGWARDYDDLAPVKGIITGSRRHLLHVSVDVEPIADEA